MVNLLTIIFALLVLGFWMGVLSGVGLALVMVGLGAGLLVNALEDLIRIWNE